MTAPSSRFLPEVRAVAPTSGTHARLSLFVPAALTYFEGHFPGLPILPGVVQLDWVVRLARLHLPAFGSGGPPGAFQSLENIKFLAVVRPDMALALDIGWEPELQKLAFSYTSEGRAHATGRICWGVTR